MILFRGEDGNLIPKVTDFGLVKRYNSDIPSNRPFMAYGAPEIITGIQYDLFKADIWLVSLLIFLNVYDLKGSRCSALCDADGWLPI